MAFKTTAIDHSAIPPHGYFIRKFDDLPSLADEPLWRLSVFCPCSLPGDLLGQRFLVAGLLLNVVGELVDGTSEISFDDDVVPVKTLRVL